MPDYGMPADSDGRPHDYGMPCCCVDCDGPDGVDCVPDLYGARCARCGREAVHDDPEGAYVATIVARLARQAEGQTSWLG